MAKIFSSPFFLSSTNKIEITNNMNKQLFGILSLIGLLFIFLFIMLSYYSRLATDDYYFIGDIKNHGMFEQVYFQYMNWSGRYAATMAINIFYNLFGLQQHYYLILPVFSLLFLVLGTSLVVYQVFLYLKIHIRFIYALLIGLLFSSCLFFLSFEIGESWFWYCGYSSYLWSITAFIWGIYFLLLNKNIVISTILASLCFIYVGGASEIYSAIIGLCYTIYLYKSYRNKNSFWWINKFVRNKVIIAYCFFALSFLLFLVAPGNYLRDGLFPEHHIPE
ncbi:MAG: hypothetical protein JNL69_04195, partial [Bacteroidia bacterium]|nr:hypothetical protein [Bacteroidia bacterium]